MAAVLDVEQTAGTAADMSVLELATWAVATFVESGASGASEATEAADIGAAAVVRTQVLVVAAVHIQSLAAAGAGAAVVVVPGNLLPVPVVKDCHSWRKGFPSVESSAVDRTRSRWAEHYWDYL